MALLGRRDRAGPGGRRLRPLLPDGTPEIFSVYGGLLCAPLWRTSALASRGTVGSWCVVRRGRWPSGSVMAGTTTGWCSGRPRRIHAVTFETETGQVSDAIRLADEVNLDAVASLERRTTHLYELARCYEQRGNDAAVLVHLQMAYRQCPQDFQYKHEPQRLLASLVRWARPSFATEVRDFAAKVGVIPEKDRPMDGMPIGQLIRLYRINRKMTMAQVATHAGISARYLEMIEAGTKTPSVPTLRRIAQVLRVRTSALISDAPGQDDAGSAATGLSAVERALYHYGPLYDTAAEPPDLADLAARVEAARTAWFLSPNKFSDVLAVLPGLIVDVEYAVRAYDRSREACRLAAEVHRLRCRCASTPVGPTSAACSLTASCVTRRRPTTR